MNHENIVEVEHISKGFKTAPGMQSRFRDKIPYPGKKKREKRMVLNDISFSLKRGEAIGLIGHNGCGKSTTLKLLSKIMYPDSGSIRMYGRVSSLIELGAGFHPDMSGRENIYINASIFGLNRKEIDARLDDIIAFSELEEFIDNPVRTYSSGMYMRLAFSVAINVDADILLIDEILAVGDVNFQTKCFERLREIKAQGTAIIIVSHSLGQVEQICDRTIWIHEGQIKMQGIPRDVHLEYLKYMGKERTDALQNDGIGAGQKGSRWGNGDAVIENVAMLDANGNKLFAFKTGEDIKIQFDYVVKNAVKDAVFGIGIFRRDGLQYYGTNTRIDKMDRFDLEKNGILQVQLSMVNLLPGEYVLDVTIESGMGIPVDYYRDAYRFKMYSEIEDVGVTRIAHKWSLDC